jgi:16S rRNA (cytosine1402-N4)-methyltransferase
MATNNFDKPHISVLLKEVIENLAIKDGGYYLDCTFGAGGYSDAILKAAAVNLYAIDQDPLAQEFATALKQKFTDIFHFQQGNFAEAKELFAGKKFDGIVLDLGVSSMQLDQAHRGFSFMHDGPLDMRMSQQGQSAADVIANASEKELSDIIYWYGEEVQSRSIARNIILNRQNSPITSTHQLASIIKEAMHYRPGKIDPATKTFQALRIFVNQELKSLENFLSSVKDLLNINGRIIIVSFHALEDRIVKKFFKEHEVKKITKSKYHRTAVSMQDDEQHWLKLIHKKSLTPSREEVLNNPRSRSARMRVAEKIT